MTVVMAWRTDAAVSGLPYRLRVQLSEMPGGGYSFGAPKSDAGIIAIKSSMKSKLLSSSVFSTFEAVSLACAVG
jgi:hypothetical protein